MPLASENYTRALMLDLRCSLLCPWLTGLFAIPQRSHAHSLYVAASFSWNAHSTVGSLGLPSEFTSEKSALIILHSSVPAAPILFHLHSAISIFRAFLPDIFYIYFIKHHFLIQLLFFLLYCCAGWGYTVAFTKGLIMYQIYHT
jgi:hypothetical protein